MSDFKTIVRILGAVKVCENERKMDESLFDPNILKTDEITRDSLIVKLQKDGYIEGFCIIDDIDNQQYPYIVYNHSNPSITIKGMTFIEENKPLRKALEELKSLAKSVTESKIINAILKF